ncbi:MAG: hypothetical protein PHH00_03840 [Candidatus Nanoarchaeia archaeon]|nr:hypothetical protein [Candidatus Nanoarchaeia archaeon]
MEKTTLTGKIASGLKRILGTERIGDRLNKWLEEDYKRRLAKYNEAVAKIEHRKKAEEEKRLRDERIRMLDRFPGNLQEYCFLKGRKYEIIDTGSPDKEVVIERSCGHYTKAEGERIQKDISKNLVGFIERGCEGFIHCHERLWVEYNYNCYLKLGVPVRKRK